MHDYHKDPNPNTYTPNPKTDLRIKRPEVFDPALKHFLNAFRFGEPIFQEPEIAHRWFEARQQVIELLLRSIQESQWHEHLVLRGSLLLKAWMGDIAREPGDIDWVFRPETIQPNDNLTAKRLFDDVFQMFVVHKKIGNIDIDALNIATDDIWTYTRAEGRRILIPWQAEGLPAGTLQMDVVFGERLLNEPILTPIPTQSGRSIPIWAASKELSLAWKLLWLETDRYPQGKDLYDATLLAEQTQLPFDLLHQVFESNEDWLDIRKHDVPNFNWKSGYPWLVRSRDIHWDKFILEYPWVEGDAQSWLDRLSLALAPTFADIP